MEDVFTFDPKTISEIKKYEQPNYVNYFPPSISNQLILLHIDSVIMRVMINNITGGSTKYEKLAELVINQKKDEIQKNNDIIGTYLGEFTEKWNEYISNKHTNLPIDLMQTSEENIELKSEIKKLKLEIDKFNLDAIKITECESNLKKIKVELNEATKINEVLNINIEQLKVEAEQKQKLDILSSETLLTLGVENEKLKKEILESKQNLAVSEEEKRQLTLQIKIPSTTKEPTPVPININPSIPTEKSEKESTLLKQSITTVKEGQLSEIEADTQPTIKKGETQEDFVKRVNSYVNKRIPEVLKQDNEISKVLYEYMYPFYYQKYINNLFDKDSRYEGVNQKFGVASKKFMGSIGQRFLDIENHENVNDFINFLIGNMEYITLNNQFGISVMDLLEIIKDDNAFSKVKDVLFKKNKNEEYIVAATVAKTELTKWLTSKLTK
jgi:hypothetical protein